MVKKRNKTIRRKKDHSCRERWWESLFIFKLKLNKTYKKYIKVSFHMSQNNQTKNKKSQ